MHGKVHPPFSDSEGLQPRAQVGRRTDRRTMLKGLSAAGAGTALFSRALAALASDRATVTKEMIQQAEWVAGLDLTDEDRGLMLEDMQERVASYARIRRIPIDNGVPPALRFEPIDPSAPEAAAPPTRKAQWRNHTVTATPGDEDLAWASVAQLSRLIRHRELSCVELTKLLLARIERLDPLLHCVITLTDELALQQAERADRELAAGRYRGPLHGIPWGAKDLLAVPGYRTTWGATPYKEQVRPEQATVVSRLEEAGTVLLAKLSLGALAWGDVWFDAMTRNPWKLDQGSSGSSAGSAAATAAGLAPFALGSETLGSIVSPCSRCGVTGLRPTFGRVSRHGAMALSWSMDKIGPIARTVEDCAVVFDAIHGADRLDRTAIDRPFSWPPRQTLHELKVGYVPRLFEEDRTVDVEEEESKRLLMEWQEIDRQTLEVLQEIGIQLHPLELPGSLPVDDLELILDAEAAAAFDDLTRSGRDDLLVRQIENAWPNVFRQSQFIPAVEYIRANRIRTMVMHEMAAALKGFDAYVCPSYGGNNLLLTNLTGHPCVVVPNGFRSDGTPTSITFTGPLFGEESILLVAQAYQEATDHHLRRPSLPV